MATTTLPRLVAEPQGVYMAGDWTAGEGESLEVKNPASGETIAELATASEPQAHAALEAAAAAKGAGGARAYADRASYLCASPTWSRRPPTSPPDAGARGRQAAGPGPR